MRYVSKLVCCLIFFFVVPQKIVSGVKSELFVTHLPKSKNYKSCDDIKIFSIEFLYKLMGTLELSYIALDVEKQFMCRHVGNTFHKHFIYYQSCLFMNRRIIYLQTWHQFTVKFSKDLCYTVHYFVTKIYHPYILKIFRYSE